MPFSSKLRHFFSILFLISDSDAWLISALITSLLSPVLTDSSYSFFSRSIVIFFNISNWFFNFSVFHLTSPYFSLISISFSNSIILLSILLTSQLFRVFSLSFSLLLDEKLLSPPLALSFSFCLLPEAVLL